MDETTKTQSTVQRTATFLIETHAFSQDDPAWIDQIAERAWRRESLDRQNELKAEVHQQLGW